MIVDKVLKAHPHEVLTVRPSDAILGICGRFGQTKWGIAMVCDEQMRLIGVVSLGDIVQALSQRGAEVLHLPVRMVMTVDIVTCDPTEEIESALRKMTDRGTHHLPVVENEKLVGVIEKPQALETLYDEASLDFTQLRNYIFKTGGRY